METTIDAGRAGNGSVATSTLAHDYMEFDSRGESWGAVVAFSMWLRVGIAAAGLFVIGASQLVAGEQTPGVALALALGGVALLLAAWHYGRRALQRMDDFDSRTIADDEAVDANRSEDRDVSARPALAAGYRRTYAID